MTQLVIIAEVSAHERRTPGFDDATLSERSAQLARETPSHDDVVFVVARGGGHDSRVAALIRRDWPAAEIIFAPPRCAGPGCVALLAIGRFDPKQPLVVVDLAKELEVGARSALDDVDASASDAAIVTTRRVEPHRTYVHVGEAGDVIEVGPRRTVNSNAASGAFWFRSSGDFFEAIMTMIRKDASVDGRFEIAPACNQLLLRNGRIAPVALP